MTTLERIVSFLNSIGITTSQGAVDASTFLPGVRVVNGALIYDIASLRWPGDLLHEAGHIATAPAELRHRLNDDVELPSSVLYATEVEATAWAFAAVQYLKLEPTILFHEGGYQGVSSRLITTYTLGVYPGAFGLSQAGMTHVGVEASQQGLAVYPIMMKWLRD